MNQTCELTHLSLRLLRRLFRPFAWPPPSPGAAAGASGTPRLTSDRVDGPKKAPGLQSIAHPYVVSVGKISIMSRSSSRELRIRVPLFSVVYFSKGTLPPQKKETVKGHRAGGPLVQTEVMIKSGTDLRK